MKKFGLFLSLLLMVAGVMAQDMSEPMVDITALSVGTGTIADYLTQDVGRDTTCALEFDAFEAMSEDDMAQTGQSFACLLEAVEAAGLTETLAGEGPFTVFAPTDRAFYAFAQTQGVDTPANLFADTEMLSDILMYHVVPDAGSLNDIYVSREADAEVFTALATAGGGDLTVDFPMGETAQEIVVQVGQATEGNPAFVSGTTIDVDNGYIIPISQVLVPPMAE